MDNEEYPITDWSEIGRINYIEMNRNLVELIISQACEDFHEEGISTVFRSESKAIDSIIQLFLSPQFDCGKLPIGIPENIMIFSQLNFWIKFKTGRSLSAQSLSSEYKEDEIVSATESTDHDCDMKILAKNVEKLNKVVASNVINYWLMANKKLLDELSPEKVSVTESTASNSQKTRYKADAAFRYLYFFCGIDKQPDSFVEYQRKYLVKGENIPQYVAGGAETHQSKHQVRQSIKKIIRVFYEIHSVTDDNAYLMRSLLKGIAKNAILDVYEINKKDPDHKTLVQILKSFKFKPSVGHTQ